MFPVRQLDASITNVFYRPGPYTWRPDGVRRHTGLDIEADGPSVEIHATRTGVVDRVSYDRWYGNHIIIQTRDNHGRRVDCLYAHLSRVLVRDGARLVGGRVIGIMGSTGNVTGQHLHYEESVAGSAWAYGNVRGPRWPWNMSGHWDPDHKVFMAARRAERERLS